MSKLSDGFIELGLQSPPRGHCFYADSEVQGLWVRVTPKHKFFVVQWTDSAGARNITIGEHGSMNISQARQDAKRLLQAFCETGVQTKEDIITLTRVFEKYLAVRILRPSTIRIYKEIMRRCFGDWKDLAVTEISKSMVEEHYRALTKTTRAGTKGKAQANLAMKLLRALLNFASDYYETPDGKPLLSSNPVSRLSQNKSWHRIPARQSIIPDHKLSDWYTAVLSLKSQTMTDYLLFVLLTGLRRNEAASLRWSDVQLSAKLINIPGAATKNHRDHSLPMSPFIERLLKRRYGARRKSEFVFPGRGKQGCISGFSQVLKVVRERSGCRFLIHDLRRTFLTMAERVEVPHYALKRLANHAAVSDVTADYVVIDIERLRPHVNRICEQFLALLFPDFNRCK